MGLDTVEYVLAVEDLFQVRRLRNALLEKHPALNRQALRPGTACYSLEITSNTELNWRAVGENPNIKLKGSFSEPGCFSTWFGAKPVTLGELAERVVVEQPATLRNRDEGWTNEQLVEILLRLVEREQGLEPHRHHANSEFVREMRMD